MCVFIYYANNTENMLMLFYGILPCFIWFHFFFSLFYFISYHPQCSHFWCIVQLNCRRIKYMYLSYAFVESTLSFRIQPSHTAKYFAISISIPNLIGFIHVLNLFYSHSVCPIKSFKFCLEIKLTLFFFLVTCLYIWRAFIRILLLVLFLHRFISRIWSIDFLFYLPTSHC